jgi:hypothetical protein
MAVGTYGVTRPADVDVNDIDMYYKYVPNRQTSDDGAFIKLDAAELLSYCTLPEDDPNYVNYTTPQEGQNLLEGLYNLRLPASTFNQLGIYTIYIKPKITMATIVNYSVLSSLPSIKGIVLDINELPEGLKANNALQGFRIEYLLSDGTKMRNVVRYVVTSNKAVPVTENVGNISQKAVRYRFDDAGTLLFIQVTPSSSSDVKPNATPFIGNPAGVILLSNTYFTPVVVEIELVENTIDTLADIVAGEQVKDIQKGILTHYDKDRVITKQFNLYEIKEDTTNVPLFEVKEKRTTIDESQNFDDVTKL